MYKIPEGLDLIPEGSDFLLSLKDSNGRILFQRKARPEELLALKLVAEGEDLREVARREGVSVSWLRAVLQAAEAQGVLTKLPSLIARSGGGFREAWFPSKEFKHAEVFTLQWHITYRCDFSCRHCYGRGPHREPNLKEAQKVLEELYIFCEKMRVHGQISFTGGNPFLHPHFLEIYREASNLGFTLAILGNPVSTAWLEKLMEIEPPAFYQVSLEGLLETNDRIRGAGHFQRTLKFLFLLKELGIPSTVMLTLHAENQCEVLPLARRLSGLVDTFSFNRLSLVGKGRELSPTERQAFINFLEEYLEESRNLPYLHLKDNLFNRLLYLRGEPLCGGCTGFGCGAAFNFLALLPDGEIHACRKFSSPLGNLYQESLEEIYFSKKAEAYRCGPQECRHCQLYAICRGCLAVIATYGLDPFVNRDPFCPGPVEKT